MNLPPQMGLPPQEPRQSEVLTVDGVLAIVWRSAVESFVRTILVVVFGSIAIGIASSICGEMVPSTPPGFGQKLETEETPHVTNHQWGVQFGQHHFLIVFILIFGLTLWFRLFRRQSNGEPSVAESHAARITQHVSENWFRLIVGNAFGALISAIVVVWIQRFTIPNLLLSLLFQSVVGLFHSLAQALFGVSHSDTVAAWFNWYGENQLKFTFWFFYLSAICDDLGLPNFKTLGLWILRRFVKRIKRQHPV